MDGNAALGRRWFEKVWNQRRADLIQELATADCVGHREASTTGGPALTTSGPHEWTELYTAVAHMPASWARNVASMSAA